MDWKPAQLQLKATGYYTGLVDNDPGPGTWAALLGFAARARPGLAIHALRGRALARQPEWEAAGRVCHFVAETCHESAGYTRMREAMSYSTAQRIHDVWPTRFPTVASAASYVRNAEKLANFVYARPKEGNTEPGDGWRYRGGGDIQTTFKNNFRAASEEAGVDLVAYPERISDPDVAIRTALGFYRRNGVFAFLARGEYQRARALVNTGSSETPRSKIKGIDEVDRGRMRLLDLFR